MSLRTDIQTHDIFLADPVKLAAFCDSVQLESIAKGGPIEYIYGERPEMRVEDGVAVLPISGPIAEGITPLEYDLGATSPSRIHAMLDAAEADPQVRGVLLDVNSPGGTVSGIPELAARVASFPKPVASYVGTLGASAAYWVASQAAAVYAAPSATVGSVGVYSVYRDVSQMLESNGIKTEVFKAGDLKGAGIPGTSLSDAQRADIQAGVDALHDDFKSAVRSKRTTVQDDSMRGQTFNGKEAAARGLVTGLYPSISHALKHFSSTVSVNR